MKQLIIVLLNVMVLPYWAMAQLQFDAADAIKPALLKTPVYAAATANLHNTHNRAAYPTGNTAITATGTQQVQLQPRTLPQNNPLAQLTHFSATAVNSLVNLSWQISNETGIDHFVLEQSTDNNNFKITGTIAASGNSAGSIYSYNAGMAQRQTTLYYRLKLVMKDDSDTAIATTSVINNNNSTNYFVLHPKLVSNENAGVTMLFNSTYKGTAKMYLYNSNGQLMQTRILAVNYDNNSLNLNTAILRQGQYTITIMTDDGYIILPQQILVKQN